MANTPNVAFITNIPAPYREAIHELVSNVLDDNYTVLYCDQKEPNREWSFTFGDYKHFVLKRQMITYKGRYIHLNLDVWKTLNQLDPDVVITAGSFNPTMLIAFVWAKLHRKKHIPMTDGWLKSENSLSLIHRWIRKIVYTYSDAYIGASKHSLNLYRSYHCSDEQLFQSHLCANNGFFAEYPQQDKKYDLMFSGQFIERKMPFFFAEVAKFVKEKRGECSVLLLGSGELKEAFLSKLAEYGIESYYAGYVSQDELPQYYKSAKLFLFPTLQDPWGVVANEAMAAGTPVITCDNAGVANDLVIHEVNGLILPLVPEHWAEKATILLDDAQLYARMSKQAHIDVQEFSYENAAYGILNAIKYTLTERKR
jgi:glycosyltransferase involved in cell wall biosynthesis